ncbi:MAG: DUF2784 domain-containing protein [Nitrospirota bacterium]|nr:DUF2784 domain-containing protein [Nitrospirota bacterium]
MTPDFYNILADLTVALHALFVLFVVGGQALILTGWLRKWHWVRSLTFRLLHCAAILFVVISTWLGMICPLTTLENYLRRLAGTGAYEMSFIGYWLNRLLFYRAPDWAFILIYTVFGGLVVITYIVYPPQRNRQ